MFTDINLAGVRDCRVCGGMEFRLQAAGRVHSSTRQEFLRSSCSPSPCRLKAELRTSNRTVAAFSLIEIMVALVVLGVALVGLTQGITTALTSNKESELQTQAALIAAGQIETLRATGDLIDGETEGDGGEGLSMYRWKQSVSATDLEGLHEVSVTVANTNSSKAIYELQTYIFDPGDTTQDDARDQKNPAGAKKKDKQDRRRK